MIGNGFIEREKLHGKSINHDGGSASFGTVVRECTVCSPWRQKLNTDCQEEKK